MCGPCYGKQRSLSSALLEDEVLLWSGRPRQGLRWQPSDLLLVPVGLSWGGLSVCLLVLGATIPKLFGVVFLGYSVFLLVGRFLVDAKRRSRTEYGLTDRRVIFIAHRELKTMALSDLPPISIQRHGDGRGTLWFGRLPAWALLRSPDGSYLGPQFQRRVPRFDSIENAEGVRDLILAQAASAQARQSG